MNIDIIEARAEMARWAANPGGHQLDAQALGAVLEQAGIVEPLAALPEPAP